MVMDKDLKSNQAPLTRHRAGPPGDAAGNRAQPTPPDLK